MHLFIYTYVDVLKKYLYMRTCSPTAWYLAMPVLYTMGKVFVPHDDKVPPEYMSKPIDDQLRYPHMDVEEARGFAVASLTILHTTEEVYIRMHTHTYPFILIHTHKYS